MTRIIKTDTICDRCDTDLAEAVTRHMDEGGPGQCPRCGLGFEVSAEWLAENGYETEGDDDGYTMTITDTQIHALRHEADEAGDLEQVALCLLALGEDPTEAEAGTELWLLGDRGVTADDARAECARVIAEAEAA